MTFSTDRPHFQSRYLVLFTWGSPTQQERWANWDNPVLGYKKVPKMAFRFPQNVGTVDHKELQLEVIRTAETATFLDFLSSGAAVPPVTIDVMEQIPAQISGDQGRFFQPWRGWVTRITTNSREKRGIYRIEALTAKQKLDVPLGMQCNLTCEFRLFGRGCSTSNSGPQFSVQSRTSTVTAVNGYEVTVAGGWSALSAGYHFRRGYLAVEGLNIDIWDWDPLTPNVFLLSKPAPPAWVSKNVRMVPGCDQTIESCRAKGNEDNFGGFGIKMPDYDPSFENTQ